VSQTLYQVTPIKRLAVLASGAGSNLAHIHGEIAEGRLVGCELALVISNNSKSGALEIARRERIPSEHLSILTAGGDSKIFEEEFLRILHANQIDLIALAGYMKRIPDAVVDAYSNKILNVHPALLPSFGGSAMYGIRVHEAVLARGCKVSGATVHFVTREFDAGPIVMQSCCPVLDADTPESLERRVRDIEFEIYPKAIQLLAQDKIIVENNRTYILE
jgi:phosphoribosylglycinamide formyltransferase-1